MRLHGGFFIMLKFIYHVITTYYDWQIKKWKWKASLATARDVWWKMRGPSFHWFYKRENFIVMSYSLKFVHDISRWPGGTQWEDRMFGAVIPTGTARAVERDQRLQIRICRGRGRPNQKGRGRRIWELWSK